ncbi:MAG: hypothetical protein AAFX08_11710 [Pseudomonadota bacterium]
MSPKTPEALFVVGMHRSATSAVSGALQFCGYSHGHALMPAAEDNPSGFWEQSHIVNLNERMLSAIGASWADVPAYRHAGWPERGDEIDWLRGTFAKEAAGVFANAFKETDGPVAVKDPRLCLTLPIWTEAAEAAGYAPRTVLVYRDPWAVAASLERRNKTPFDTGVRLWLNYLSRAARRLAPGTPIIAADEFLADPVTQLAALGVKPASDEDAAKLKDFVRPSEAKTPEPSGPRAHLPVLAAQFEKALEGAREVPGDQDFADLVDRIQRMLTHANELSGRVYYLSKPQRSKPMRRSGRRDVVYHCHLFKNAGTSVDDVLKRNFGDRWINTEFPTHDAHSLSDCLRSYIIANNYYDAVSSHTGNWWLGYEETKVAIRLVVFLRHPLLRIKSAYQFERTQEADTKGAQIARETDLAGYVAERLDNPGDFALQNFQARRLGFMSAKVLSNVRQASNDAVARLAFLGLVERFNDSMERLEAYIRPAFPDFSTFETHKNATDAAARPIDERLDEMRAELGVALFDRLTAENALDLDIYQKVAARFD